MRDLFKKRVTGMMPAGCFNNHANATPLRFVSISPAILSIVSSRLEPVSEV